MSQSPARRARRHSRQHPQHRRHQHLWKSSTEPGERWVCIGCGEVVSIEDGAPE